MVQELVRAFGEHFKGKGLISVIAKLGLCSGIYNLWRERNEITFKDKRFNRLSLIKAIEFDIQANLNGRGLKDKGTPNFRFVASIWNVQLQSL